jgi:hypothetical protein
MPSGSIQRDTQIWRKGRAHETDATRAAVLAVSPAGLRPRPGQAAARLLALQTGDCRATPGIGSDGPHAGGSAGLGYAGSAARGVRPRHWKRRGGDGVSAPARRRRRRVPRGAEWSEGSGRGRR